MKTKLIFRPLLVLLPVFAVMLIISSCTKEEIVIVPESEIPTDFSLKSADIPAPDDMICDLIAGQNISVGQVVYSHDDDNNLLVEYVATGGWMISEVHFYVGNMEDFEETCMNKNKKAVQIGKFPYSDSGLNDDTIRLTIPLDELEGIEPGDDGYLVVAHAVVKRGGQEETAFANCTYQPIITAVKALFSNGFYGESEGDRFSDNRADWCYWLGTNIYEGEDTYPIGSWEKYYGKAHVYDDEGYLYIDVTANDTLNLVKVWVYVGTMAGLESLLNEESYDGHCPEYWRFPLSSDAYEPSHKFTIPLPTEIQSSKSFKDEFGIKRWGWISYYNF